MVKSRYRPIFRSFLHPPRMQSLLPDMNRRNRDHHTFFLMMMGFLLIWILLSRPAPVDPDAPIVPPNPEPNQQVEQVQQTDPDDPEHAEQIVAETKAEPAWVTLGSMDSNSPYRMLVTLTNRGAAPSRIELNTNQYRDVQELSGYLGQIVADQNLAELSGDGVTVQVVGPGTPADKFGLKIDDKIVQVALQNRSTGKPETVEVQTFADLRKALQHTKPGDYVDLTVVRNGNKIEQRIQLAQYPMDLIRPENVSESYEEYRSMGGLRGVDERSDQLSFLMTLQQINGEKLPEPDSQKVDNSKRRGVLPPDATLERELDGVGLRNELWEVLSVQENEAVFRRTVPGRNLEVLKTYRLRKREDADPKFKIGAGYELTLDITIKNLDTQSQEIAYQLDGPTGLPLEGGWYALKMGPDWGSYGIRDIVVRLHGNKGSVVSSNVVHIDKVPNYWINPWIDNTPDYIGVDSRFFQCTLMPNRSDTEIADNEMWHSKIFPIRVGAKNTEWRTLTNISFRLWSKPTELQPNEAIEHSYTVFAGPKDTAILAEYGLGETISYGWFWFVAQPLLAFLHFLHWLGLPYALAIIALTVCVRLVLLPMSIKQARGAIKMQEIQPELKALAEQYKDDLQARSKAQRELFQKHNFNPLSGCLPIFIQIPIFIGLYKALAVDAGLYGAPLISSSVRWCSDLSAPDMLYDWSSFWNGIGWVSFNTGQGMGLGPYFSLLPVLTVVLFLTQMIITMPPPTDEQSRMMRNMMFIMMPLMGLLFFKFPSGLCLYFTISTLWGLVERRFIPKVKAKPVSTTIDVEPTESNKSSQKKGGRSQPQTPAKPEGRFAKWWREVLEKASEQQKLGQQNQNKNKKKKKR